MSHQLGSKYNASSSLHPAQAQGGAQAGVYFRRATLRAAPSCTKPERKAFVGGNRTWERAQVLASSRPSVAETALVSLIFDLAMCLLRASDALGRRQSSWQVLSIMSCWQFVQLVASLGTILVLVRHAAVKTPSIHVNTTVLLGGDQNIASIGTAEESVHRLFPQRAIIPMTSALEYMLSQGVSVPGMLVFGSLALRIDTEQLPGHLTCL